MHAVNINPAPTAEFIPICSPITATANAVPQRGSVEKINVVSAAERFSNARVSMYMVRAVVMHPVQKRPNKIAGSVNHSFHGKDVDSVDSDDSKPARSIPIPPPLPLPPPTEVLDIELD